MLKTETTATTSVAIINRELSTQRDLLLQTKHNIENMFKLGFDQQTAENAYRDLGLGHAPAGLVEVFEVINDAGLKKFPEHTTDRLKLLWEIGWKVSNIETGLKPHYPEEHKKLAANLLSGILTLRAITDSAENEFYATLLGNIIYGKHAPQGCPPALKEGYSSLRRNSTHILKLSNSGQGLLQFTDDVMPAIEKIEGSFSYEALQARRNVNPFAWAVVFYKVLDLNEMSVGGPFKPRSSQVASFYSMASNIEILSKEEEKPLSTAEVIYGLAILLEKRGEHTKINPENCYPGQLLSETELVPKVSYNKQVLNRIREELSHAPPILRPDNFLNDSAITEMLSWAMLRELIRRDPKTFVESIDKVISSGVFTWDNIKQGNTIQVLCSLPEGKALREILAAK